MRSTASEATQEYAHKLACKDRKQEYSQCVFDRDLLNRGQTTILLTALLALPSLQQFRCRRSMVGHLPTLVSSVCLFLVDIELAVMLLAACMHIEPGAYACLISVDTQQISSRLASYHCMPSVQVYLEHWSAPDDHALLQRLANRLTLLDLGELLLSESTCSMHLHTIVATY